MSEPISDQADQIIPGFLPSRWLVRFVLLPLIGFYRYAISPFFPSSCRFHPTCSQYAKEALLTHGLYRGTLLTLRRLGRCHPWHAGGYDPVPKPHSCKHQG